MPVIPHKYNDDVLQRIYENGFRAGYFGADANNTSFVNFATPYTTEIWKRGNDEGSDLRERIINEKSRNERKNKIQKG